MIELHVVEECPHTRTSKGVLRLHPDVISIFAGAVYDRIEWMALMVGERSENGLDITINSLLVPEQTRSIGNCELVHPEPLTDGIVGVVHSHHNMSAFFSQTDNKQLNPRFPVSIVLAQNKHSCSEEYELLGFTYKVEGRAPLPCGDIGIIDYTVLPTEVPEFWPITAMPGHNAPAPNSTLNQCARMIERKLEGKQHICRTQCGIINIEKASAIFGRDSKEFMEIVVKQTKHTTKYKGHGGQSYKGHYQGGTFIPTEDAQGGYNFDKASKREQRWKERYNGDGDDGRIAHWSSLE